MTATTKSSASARRGITPLQRHEILWAYAFLGPAFFFLIVLIIIPISFAFWISLHDWSLIPRPNPFIGMQNYLAALQDPLTVKSLQNTLIYTIVVVPLGMVLALLLALIMNQEGLPLRTFYRAVYFVPVITSWVAVSFIWVWIGQHPAGADRHHWHQMAGLAHLGLASHYHCRHLERFGFWHGDLPGWPARHSTRALRSRQD